MTSNVFEHPKLINTGHIITLNWYSIRIRIIICSTIFLYRGSVVISVIRFWQWNCNNFRQITFFYFTIWLYWINSTICQRCIDLIFKLLKYTNVIINKSEKNIFYPFDGLNWMKWLVLDSAPIIKGLIAIKMAPFLKHLWGV